MRLQMVCEADPSKIKQAQGLCMNDLLSLVSGYDPKCTAIGKVMYVRIERNPNTVIGSGISQQAFVLIKVKTDPKR